jgi:hypothetical protein
MENSMPKHISELLAERRDKFIVQMSEEGYKLTEIAYIFKLTTPRIHQIILSKSSKELNK